MLPCIVAGIFANLGHDIMARMGRYGRRTQSTGINRGCRSRPTQLECGQRRPPSAESDGKCRACLAFPEVPASDLPVLIRSRRNATCPVWPSAAPAPARCEPVPAFPLLPGPPTCPAKPSAASAASRCEPFSPNRLTPAPCNSGSGPGTMAAGAREQAASCDAFVLSRRLPAPDAPPSRTFPLCLIAKPFPEPSPNHGPVLGRDCRCEFRQARSRIPLPEGVLAVGGMTDGVWQGGSVMSTLL